MRTLILLLVQSLAALDRPPPAAIKKCRKPGLLVNCPERGAWIQTTLQYPKLPCTLLTLANIQICLIYQIEINKLHQQQTYQNLYLLRFGFFIINYFLKSKHQSPFSIAMTVTKITCFVTSVATGENEYSWHGYNLRTNKSFSFLDAGCFFPYSNKL